MIGYEWVDVNGTESDSTTTEPSDTANTDANGTESESVGTDSQSTDYSTDSASEVSSEQTDSLNTDSSGTAVTDTLTDVASDTTGPDTGQTTDTGNDTHSDTGTSADTTSTADTTVTKTDSDTTNTGSDTLTPCAPLPAGTVLYDESQMGDFVPNGEIGVTMEAVTGQSFTQTMRITTYHFSSWPYDARAVYLPKTGVADGDHLEYEFWTRCVSSGTGDCMVSLHLEQANSPWHSLVQYYAVTGSEWTLHQVPIVSDVDFAAGEYQITYRLGFDNQVVDIAPTLLMNYGAFMPTDRPDCLPDNTRLYSAVEIISPPRLFANVGLGYRYQVDVNGYPRPDLSISPLPDWLNFTAAYGELSGNPDYTDVGTTDITVNANNGFDSDSQTFQIEVRIDPDARGHWPLDQDASDATGLGGNGTIHGGVTWQVVSGANYSAVLNSVDGTRDYVELPTASIALNDLQNNDYTIAAWVKILSVPAGSNISDNEYGAGIVIKVDANESLTTGLWYGNDQCFHATHKFDPSSPNRTELQAKSGVMAPDGTYHHVAMEVSRGYGFLALYVDDRYVAGDVISGDETDHDYGTAPWRFGLADPNAVNYGLWGNLEIDDVRFYSRTLNVQEIQTLAGF